MNAIILTGNLGADPESTFTANEGVHVVKFSLAFRSTHKDEKTNWIKVTCFNKQADLAEEYLHKGARVGIIGMLDMDKWETPSGETKTAYKVIANSIEFIKTNGNGQDRNETPL